MASFRHFNKYVPIIVDITNARYVPKIDDPKLGPEELQFNYSRVAYDTRRSLWVVGIEGHDEFTEIPQEKDEEHYINYVSFSLSNPDLERVGYWWPTLILPLSSYSFPFMSNFSIAHLPNYLRP